MCRTLPLDVVVITEAGRHYAPGWSEHDGWPVYAVPQSGAVGALLRSIPAFLAGGGMRRYRRVIGEGLTFGIPEGTAGEFMAARGFHPVIDAGADDLKAAYFTGQNAGRAVAGGYGIVTGWVSQGAKG